MSALEPAFVSALSVLLVGVVLFGFYAVRSALLLTRSPVAGSVLWDSDSTRRRGGHQITGGADA